ncbi:MAG: chitobiase/beta-hexosaminidase C-terminal domain-containing protein, partial [Lachnospiraceae bacterium]|nr:chitobiase/beta-hexosaminidase C-terminal domain-containing protein [Lachnospiraceae bacterium]
LEHIDRAISLEAMHEEAYRVLSEILVAQKDITGAIKVVESCLPDFAESEILYGELISLYEREGRPEKIKKLLDDCKSSKVRKAFSVYITPDPKINYSTGRYRSNLDIKLYGKDVTFYYTLDGSEPDKNSQKYEQPISISKGVTELKVIAYSRLGIPSDVIYRKYTIS